MAEVFEYPAAGKDAPQLHDELAAAGLDPLRVEVRPDVVETPLPDGPDGEPRPPLREVVGTLVLTYPDGQQRAPVDAAVAAHVPQARYDPPTLAARRAPLLRANRRRSDLTRLRRLAAGAADTADLSRSVLGLLDYLEKEAEA